MQVGDFRGLHLLLTVHGHVPCDFIMGDGCVPNGAGYNDCHAAYPWIKLATG